MASYLVVPCMVVTTKCVVVTAGNKDILQKYDVLRQFWAVLELVCYNWSARYTKLDSQ